MLHHEHFEHISDANKKYLGDWGIEDFDDHGTHVAGLIVGKKYGVIQDNRVMVRSCSFVLCVLYLAPCLFRIISLCFRCLLKGLGRGLGLSLVEY